MADIFVSYAREDRPHVQRLAADLQTHGWTVWWDRHIHAGKHYDEVIQRELAAARAVIVLWSVHSTASRWVKTEAREGLIRDILIPLQVDQSPVPLEFRQVQSIPFEGPTFEAGSAAFDDLLEALRELAGASAPMVAAPAVERELSFEYPSETLPRVPLRARLIMAAAALVILITGGWFLFSGRREVAAPQPEQLAAASPAPAATDAPASAAPTADSTPPPPQPESASADTPVSGPAVAPSDGAALEPAPPAFQDFVAAFLKAWSSGAEQMLPFYASSVDYFDKGIVGETLIRQDRQTYERRWPQVKLQLDGPVMARQEANGFRLVFPILYEVASAARNEKARGTTELSLLIIGSSPDSFRISSHKEGTKSAPF